MMHGFDASTMLSSAILIVVHALARTRVYSARCPHMVDLLNHFIILAVFFINSCRTIILQSIVGLQRNRRNGLVPTHNESRSAIECTGGGISCVQLATLWTGSHRREPHSSRKRG